MIVVAEHGFPQSKIEVRTGHHFHSLAVKQRLLNEDE